MDEIASRCCIEGDMRKSRYVNANVHGLIRCTCLENMVMQQAVFSRLHGVYQNSVAYLTWPSNRNQRFEHSLGTMKLAGDMLFASIANADRKTRDEFMDCYHKEITNILVNITADEFSTFFSNCQEQVKDARAKWRKKGIVEGGKKIQSALGCGESYPLPDFSWRLVPGEVKQNRVATCYLLMESVRMAGMLHDVGHPPFSHAVEHALEHLSNEAEHVDGLAAQSFTASMKSLRELGDKTHEGMGQLLVDELFKSVLCDSALHDTDMCPLKIEYYIVYRMTQAILQDIGMFSSIHTIASSTVDADRLDFIRRDALSSGIGNDTVRYARIVGGMKLVEAEAYKEGVGKEGGANRTGRFIFAFPQKALDSIESFLHQRYQNYDTIVWHHRVVKSEALLDRTIQDLGLRYLKNSKNSKSVDGDGMSRRLPSNVSGLWLPFCGINKNGLTANKQIFGQWNDAWLMSTLTGEFIELCKNKERGSDYFSCEDDLLYGRLAELLYNEHYYISLVKRFGEIAGAEEYFREALLSKGCDIESMLSELQKRMQVGSRGEPDERRAGEYDAAQTAEDFLAFLPRIAELDHKRRVAVSRNPLILARMHFDSISILEDGYKDYEQLMSDIIGRVVNNLLPNRKVMEWIPEFRYLSSGVGASDAPMLYGSADRLGGLNDLSNIGHTIQLEERLRPPFYVYVRFADGDELSASDEDALREKFVRGITIELAEFYVQMYKVYIERSSV